MVHLQHPYLIGMNDLQIQMNSTLQEISLLSLKGKGYFYL